MNMTHDERHEALLQALVTRDKTRADPEIARALRECGQCRERIAGLESVVGAVSALAAERDAVLATPRSSTQAAIEPQVRATLERLRDEDRRGTSTASSRRWPWLALAAALFLAGFFIARSMRPNSRSVDQTLGSKIELISPGESLGPDDVFECRFEGPLGTRFEFNVGPTEKTPILIVEKGEPRWKPTAAERAQIPARFSWWVRTIDSTNPDLSVESEKRSSSLSP